MQDGIIKGTGNSRYLKSISNFLTQYPTYQDFAAALVAGTLPIDLNGINETGWDQIGTALNKANLLSDETAGLMGLPNTAVPDDAFGALGYRAPVGTVLWYTGETAPAGYLLCDGSAVSRTDYAALFAVVGTTFGSGGGSTTFALPDLRAKFVRGAGASKEYTATFGKTQEASSVISTQTEYSVLAVQVSDADKTVVGGESNKSVRINNSATRCTYYVRPYNIALTPIIKY